MASLLSFGVLASKMNIFLLCTISSFSVSAMLFLVFEKRLIKNISAVWKDSLMGGILFASAYIALMAGLSMTSPLNALIFFFTPVVFYFGFNSSKRNFNIVFTILIIALAVVNIFLNNHTNSIFGTILLIGSSVSIYSLFNWVNGKKLLLEKNSREVVCIMTFIAAIVSFLLFFFTRSSYAPMLSRIEQYHLLNIIFFGSMLPAFIFVWSTNSVFKLDIRMLVIVFALTGIILSFTEFSILIIAALILIAIQPFFNSTGEKKGFSTSESIALLTLSAIIISLIMPFVQRIDMYKEINSDIKNFSSGNINKIYNTSHIDNLYIKKIDGKIRCIYETSKERVKIYPIQ